MSLNFFNDSNSLGFGISSGKLDGSKSYRPGSTNLKRAFASFANIIMMGRIPKMAELDKLGLTPEAAANYWALNSALMPAGISINEPGTPSQNILVLDKGVVNYTVYEDATPEARRFATTATTKTFSGGTISFTVGSGIGQRFNVDDQVINWSNSEALRGHVTAVNGDVISIVAHGDGASAFSAVTSFFVSTTSLDTIERMVGATDYLTPTVGTASLNYISDRTPTTVVYNTSLTRDLWIEPQMGVMRGEYRFRPGQEGISGLSKEEAYINHMEKLSSGFLWSKKQSVTNSSNASSFNGLDASITTNRLATTNGNLSLSDIDTVLIDMLGGTFSSQKLLGICSFHTLQIVENLLAALGASNQVQIINPTSGEYALQVSIIKYRNHEIHLFPVSDMQGTVANPRAFADQTGAGVGYADKLFLINPESPKVLLTQDGEGTPMLFSEKKDLQENQETPFLKKHGLFTSASFALFNEATCAVITGIQSADTAS